MLRLILGCAAVFLSYQFAVQADYAQTVNVAQWFVGSAVTAFFGGVWLIVDSLIRK